MKKHVWSLFTNIMSGQVLKKAYIVHKKTRECENVLKALWDCNMIEGYRVSPEGGKLMVFLRYQGTKSVIKKIKIISKPGHPVYYSAKQVWKIKTNDHFILFSTTKGFKTLIECKKERLGGEPIITAVF